MAIWSRMELQCGASSTVSRVPVFMMDWPMSAKSVPASSHRAQVNDFGVNALGFETARGFQGPERT